MNHSENQSQVSNVVKTFPKFPKMVGTRFSLQEFEQVKNNANSAGLTVCAFIRKRTLGCKITSKVDSRAINLLRMITGQFKMLHNEGQDIPYELIEDCQKAIKRIAG